MLSARHQLIGITLAIQACLLTTSSIPVELSAESAGQEKIADRYGRLPIAFERNTGQTDPRVQFLARGRGYTLFLTGPEAVVAVGTGGAATAVRMTLVGAARQAGASAIDELPGVTNYFMDADPAKWRTNVRSYARVRYSQVYPGIDLVYYGNQSQLEYDFVVAPRANPSRIVLDLDGADRLELDARGHLLAHVAGGRIELKRPVAYQDVDGVRTDVPIRYSIRGNRVHLRTAAYDRSRPLVVDPVLSYSTRLGGSDNDVPTGIAADSQGNAYLTGTTMSPDFPATRGALTNGKAMFVTKVNPAGSAVVYSALFPADGTAIAVDAAGNAYATGNATIDDFPTTPGALRPGGDGNVGAEAVAVKLDPAGAIVYSTYLPFHDTNRTTGMAVDTSGNAIFTGTYFSVTRPGAFAGQGGFVTKLNATGTALVYSKSVAPDFGSIGGQQYVTGMGSSVAVGADGSAYVTGSTNSPNLATTPGAYQPTFTGVYTGINTPSDGLVVKFDAAGALVYATYLGTTGADKGNGISIDASGNAYITGSTSSASFPVTAGAYQATYGGGALDGFVAKLNPSGSALAYATFLGGTASDSGQSIAVDAFGYAHVAGETGSLDFPTTSTARQATFGGGSSDAFVARLNPAGSRLLYSTFFGGGGVDRASGLAIDAAGGGYVTGSTPGSGSDTDAFILKLHLFNGRGMPANFDGDRTTDITVYRPSTGTWYVLESSSGFTVARAITLGSSTDVAVPGDYDGDGQTDIAVYRPSTGAWSILQSTTDYTVLVSYSFGGPEYAPVPGDYDGDGRTDAAVFRSTTGVWSILSSASGNTQGFAIALGRANDVPVPGDYDGDGTTDAAIYRTSTGEWTIRRSSAANTTSFTVAWGLPGDLPVPGDYDGDGLTDPAIYRPVSGGWYVLHSHSNYTTSVTRQWGLNGDLPVPGDYDGDGTSDLAVYRHANNGWYILQSSTDFASSTFFSWGLPGDVPAPAAVMSNSLAIALSSAPVSPLTNLSRMGDFDGDGRADITVYRPSGGAWYTLRSSSNYTTNGIYSLGSSGDLPVAADFDGDGWTDYAGYRPSTGAWNILLSSSSFTQILALTWGQSGDVPAPADFDGDGRTDLAFYRPSTGQWHILWSHANYTTNTMISWGLSGDIPATGDYDGDGRADVAVFRPATGEWFILQSHSDYTTSTTVAWGLNGDVPVPGDYDGDGRSDVAVYRPVSGQWYIVRSASSTSATFSFGLNGDTPVPADYDGDGITDLAVYRPGGSIWYILESRTGFTTSMSRQWGLGGDVPVLKRP